MKKYALLSLVVLGISVPGWGYHITEVSVSPASPGPSDEVSITVSGWKPAANYAIDHADLRLVGNFVMLDLYWHSEGCGAQVITSYTETKSLGKLSAGTYTVCVKSWFNGRFCEMASKSFTVSASSNGGGGGCCGCYCHGCWWLRCWPWWCCHHCGCGGGSSTSTSSSFASSAGPGSSATSFSSASSSTPNSSSSSSSFSQSTGW